MPVANSTLKRRRLAPTRTADRTPHTKQPRIDAPIIAGGTLEGTFGTTPSLSGGAAIAVTGWSHDTALRVDFTVIVDNWRATRS